MPTLTVDVGEAWIVDVLDATISNQTSYTQYGAWGTGAGTTAETDTALFTEASEARVATTRSQPAANQWRHVWTQTADAAKTITNAGVFNAATAGTLIFKGDFTGIPLASGDSIQFTLTATVD